MAQQQKSAQRSRAHKESKGLNRGSRKVHLTDLQKVLISNGGLAHGRLRGKQQLPGAPKRRPKEL